MAGRHGDGVAARRSLLIASVLTVLGAVVSDVATGDRPVHTVLLVLVAVLVGGVRVHMAGRHAGLFAAISGAVVAQPLVHAASKGLHPLTASGHVAGGAGPGSYAHLAATDVLTGLIHVLVAVAVVVMVTSCERLLNLLTRTLRRLWRHMQVPVTTADAQLATTAAGTPTGVIGTYRLWARHIGRRGPPAGRLAAA